MDGNCSENYGSDIGDLEIIPKSTYGKGVTVLYFLTNTTDGAEVGMFSAYIQFPELLSPHVSNQVIGQMWEDTAEGLVLSNCMSPLP